MTKLRNGMSQLSKDILTYFIDQKFQNYFNLKLGHFIGAPCIHPLERVCSALGVVKCIGGGGGGERGI